MSSLPEPFDLNLAAFLRGPGNPGHGVVVDPAFAKKLPALLADLAEDDPDALHQAADDFDRGTPSDIRPAFRFVVVSTGLVLMDDRLKIVGAYIGPDLALKPSMQGFGMGRELVLERALRDGSLPAWNLDEPAYSPAGLEAHTSAWNHAQDDPVTLLDRLARIDGRTR